MSLGLTAHGLRPAQPGDAAGAGAGTLSGPAGPRSNGLVGNGLPVASPGIMAPGEPIATRDAWFDRRRTPTSVYDGAAIAEGRRIEGPAIVAEPTTTIVVPPGWEISRARQDAWVLTRQ